MRASPTAHGACLTRGCVNDHARAHTRRRVGNEAGGTARAHGPIWAYVHRIALELQRMRHFRRVSAMDGQRHEKDVHVCALGMGMQVVGRTHDRPHTPNWRCRTIPRPRSGYQACFLCLPYPLRRDRC